MVDVNMNRVTIGQGGHRINTGFVHAAVENGVDFAAHIDHVGAIHDIVSVLIFGGPAKNQAGRAAVIDAELALQAVGGFLLTCKLQHQRMHLKIDSRQVVGGNAFLTQLHASIDAWMNNNTADEGLVRVERNIEEINQLNGNFITRQTE